MRILAVVALLGFLGSLFPSTNGGGNTTDISQEIAQCTEDTNNCTGLNRYCITNTSLPEDDENRECGACLNGTIEDFTAPDDEEFPDCIGISDITLEKFLAAFADALIHIGDLDIAARLTIV